MTTTSQKKIEFFGTGREFKTHHDQFSKVMIDSVSTGQFLQGKEVTELERQMAKLTNRQFGIAVNSCTDALYFSLVAAGIQPGDEVLVTDFSFIASASCILRAQAVPVFVDVNDSYLTDLSHAQQCITPKTKALIYVHLYGLMGDPQPVIDFCRKNNLILIEDSAQSIGAHWQNQPAGSLGLASCVSFDPTKPISAPGSGGIVLTNESAVAERIQRLRYHGRGQDKVHFMDLGFNSQMPTATAALLLEKLKFLSEWTNQRHRFAQQLSKGLAGVGDIQTQIESNPGSHIFHKYVLRTSKRDALKKHLQNHAIETMIHYQVPLHQHPCFSSKIYSDSSYKKAIQFSKEVLSLPIHPFLGADEIEFMISTIKQFFLQEPQ